LGTTSQINTSFIATQQSDINRGLIPRIMTDARGIKRLYPEY
jgi:hypothetical protein